MDQVREVLRYQHYAYQTEQTRCQWIICYLHYFVGKKNPKLLGTKNVERNLRIRQRRVKKVPASAPAAGIESPGFSLSRYAGSAIGQGDCPGSQQASLLNSTLTMSGGTQQGRVFAGDQAHRDALH
jgi:hypothetical protein